MGSFFKKSKRTNERTKEGTITTTTITIIVIIIKRTMEQSQSSFISNHIEPNRVDHNGRLNYAPRCDTHTYERTLGTR